jgi:chorismate mutase/prephenate dehydratase
MAKRKAKKKQTRPAAGGQKSATVASYRRKIDKIDRQIVELVNDRAALAGEIGNLKRAAGKEIYSADREQEVIDKAAQQSKGPVSEPCIRAVFREIISGSRAVEKTHGVAFLGPFHSYSHLAAIYCFGQAVDFLPVGTIGSVFEEVHEGYADYGLVPLENTTDGRIADTLENFTRFPVRICSEVQLRIHHHLLGRGKRSEVTEIHSRPQALSQCRRWLSTHLPNARTIEVTSTSAAAQFAAENPGAAAIASLQAGTHYGLKVLAENIEDNHDNITRFAVIGSESAPKTGNDKTALMFRLEHRPGSLADAMAIFKRTRINLSWIESFPLPESGGEYMFFVELEGHQRGTRIRRAIESLAKKSVRLEILGSYERTEPIG